MSQKLIIFDCDGVLVDSEIITHQVTKKCFEEIGYLISLEECIKKFTGISDSLVRDLILNQKGILISEDFFHNIQLKIIKSFECQLKPLMASVLSYLQHNNIERCVA